MGLAVAGFHRSGTSSIMQHLTLSGLNPGDDLIGANEYNPFGYFEDWEPVNFHDAALKAAGLDWASITREEIPMGDELRGRIQDYCAKRAAQAVDWGFKDPRVCQFLKVWMASDSSLKSLIIYRSPAECSWSLYRRTVREYIRGSLEPLAVSRIIFQLDHALTLWVTHNRKLLDIVHLFPERIAVVSHAGFAAGFNVAAAVNARFKMSLAPVSVETSFRKQLVTRDVEPLPVSDKYLCREAVEIWNELQGLDLAAQAYSDRRDLQFVDDPSGLTFTNRLLSMAATEMRILNAQAITACEANEGRMRAASEIAEKLQRWPFSVFFARSKKYSRLIGEILSETRDASKD